VAWNTARAARLFGEISNDQPVIAPAPAAGRSHGSGYRPPRVAGAP
jgi:hypothetical protein